MPTLNSNNKQIDNQVKKKKVGGVIRCIYLASPKVPICLSRRHE